MNTQAMRNAQWAYDTREDSRFADEAREDAIEEAAESEAELMLQRPADVARYLVDSIGDSQEVKDCAAAIAAYAKRKEPQQAMIAFGLFMACLQEAMLPEARDTVVDAGGY